MHSSKMKYVIMVCLIGIFIQPTMAQTLTDIPPNTSNPRFGSEDVFKGIIIRPALSIRGFDSSTLNGGTNLGLGLKQVLEDFLSEEDRITTVIDEIISEANSNLVTPSGSLKEKREDLEKNSRITQSRAFVALATYILENNGYTSQQTESMFGESHAQALQELKDAFLNPPGGNHMALDLVTDDSWTQSENALNIAANLNNLDPVKLGTSLTNMARAIDLYLAGKCLYPLRR